MSFLDCVVKLQGFVCWLVLLARFFVVDVVVFAFFFSEKVALPLIPIAFRDPAVLNHNFVMNEFHLTCWLESINHWTEFWLL